ncbi:hypothetical protein IFT72_10500 [Frigoribacterium sp. CFBP 8754]|uniref:hypothetical protein n=1 Tax=Frigoribacterium sp. CFBP 8754 TaxID=2775290 RepID=UPI00177F9959|nr:hypothetical protein [Frigoribacterium sp. CFBP 8754]MBD8660617.1 hypothetical protein [Frigoribacterium sp. CFBP 8754]
MDDSTKPDSTNPSTKPAATKPDPTGGARPVADAKANDLALGVVFLAVGVTLLSTLDTPWASLPLVAVGLYYLTKGLRGMRVRTAERDEAHGRAPAQAPDA